MMQSTLLAESVDKDPVYFYRFMAFENALQVAILRAGWRGRKQKVRRNSPERWEVSDA